MIVQETPGLIRPWWPEWSPDGQSVYFFARHENNVSGMYQVSANGGAPRLVVRFDESRLQRYEASPPAIGRGMFYFVLTELESDVYVMGLVWM